MSKIDNFKKQQKITKEVCSNLYKAMGLYEDGSRKNQRNDKNDLRIIYTGKHSGQWNDAIFNLHASYGFYGISNGYSAMDENVAKYMEKAINYYMEDIANKVIQFVEEDEELKRQEAKNEAKEVLKLTT